MSSRGRGGKGRGEVFPIVETFGYPANATGLDARDAARLHWCRFADTECEKFRQYGLGYCSVTYAAAADQGVRQTYAVCDHRMDGQPLRDVIQDYFGEAEATLVPEVVLTKPRQSFDYVGIRVERGEVASAIVIEAQAIDIRGGGVGPAWQAWVKGESEQWREYFTREARAKGRKDTVAYGVNMANIYKRLGLQVSEKGAFLKRIGVPLYVVMQHRPFEYLRKRVPFEPCDEGWDITFMTYDYTGKQLCDESLEFANISVVRTTLDAYVAALTADTRSSDSDREHFLERVKRKAGLGH